MSTIIDRSAWLQSRMLGVGSSDAPVIAGVDRRRSLLELWALKRGLIEPADLSHVEAIEWGHRLQPVVLQAFAERTGREVSEWRQDVSVAHPSLSWMRCTPDAVQETKERGPGLVEVKTTGAWNASDWDGEPPLVAQVQLQHQLHVMRMEWGSIVGLIGGQKLVWFDCERNSEFIAALVEKEAAFWRLVESGEEPTADGSPSATWALSALHPRDNGAELRLPDAAEEVDEELQSVKQQLALLESRKAELENWLRSEIGDATLGVVSDHVAYTWRTQTRAAHQVAESTFRVLRRKVLK